MAFAFSSFAFVPDLSRIAGLSEQKSIAETSTPWLLAAEQLYHLYRVPLTHGAGYPAELFSEALFPDFQKRYYICLGLKNQAPRREDWLASLRMDATVPLCDFFTDCFNGRFVLGAALPPLFKKTLTALEIPWIDITLHPARYLDNVLHAFSTNLPEVDAFLERESLPSHYLEAAAAHETARCLPNIRHRDFWLPKPSAFIARHIGPYPAFTSADQEFFFTDAAERLHELCREYARVFCAPGHNLREVEKELLTDLGVILLPDPRYSLFRNSYMFLAHPAVTHVVGRTEAETLESRFFGKSSERLAKALPETSPARAIYEKPFNGAFWRDMVASFTQFSTSWSEKTLWPIPKLRLALRGGGSDFDDSTSFTTATQLGSARGAVNELRRAFLAQRLFTEQLPLRREESYVTQTSQDQTAELDCNQEPHAVFCAGDNNVVLWAIVALCSFRKNGVAIDLFYVTDMEALSGENQRLLANFAITPLHSRYADNFTIRYQHTTPSAYNQFAGPELLAARGYQYSIGIHSDVLCIRYFDPYTVFTKLNVFAATHNIIYHKKSGTYSSPDEIINNYNFTEAIFDTIRINPSVLFINNTNYNNNTIQNKIISIYNNIDKNKIIHAEETIFNILISQYKDLILYIDSKYSCAPYSFNTTNPYCLHFNYIDNKPWHLQNDETIFNSPALQYLKKIWHDEARAILGDALYKNHVILTDLKSSQKNHNENTK